MKALARRGVVRVPGGWTTPSDRKIENKAEIAARLARRTVLLARVTMFFSATGLLLSLVALAMSIA